MAKFIVVIEVDEDKLLIAREKNLNEEEESESIEFTIEQELDWVAQSGISVVSVKKLDDDSEIFDAFDKYLSMDVAHYPKVLTALRKALVKKPDEMVDNVEFDIGSENEVQLETIDILENLEYIFTVERFCEMCGIKKEGE